MAEAVKKWTPPAADKVTGKWRPPADDPITALVDPSLAPETMLAQKEAAGLRTEQRKKRETFIQQNIEPGTQLDVDAELPASLRARVSFEPNVDKQVELISKREGVLGARKSKDGRNVIVRTAGEDGKTRDVLLHPLTPTLSAGDVAGATAPILKAGVASGAALLTGGASLPLTAGVMGGTAAATEVLSTTGSRVLAGQSIDPGDVAARAGGEGVINAAFPLAGAAASRGGRFVLDRMGGRGATEVATKEAAERLGLPLTASMARDSGVLREVERRSLARTGTFEDVQEGALKATKDRAVGPSGPAGVLSESDVAERVRPLAAAEEQVASRGVRTAMSDAERAANARIQAELDSGLIPTNKTTSEVGDFIREKVAGKAADSKTTQLRQGAEKLYSEANAIAQAEGVIVPPNEVSALAKKLDSDTSKALLEFAPGIKKIPGLEKMLTDPAAAPLTLPQARELRSVVYEMAHTPGPPGEGGVPRRYLSELYKALDNDLKAAVKSGSQQLQQAHAAADDFYKSKIQPLQQSDVAKLFLETDAAGRMGGDEIVRRLFRGEGNLDALRAYHEVLGADSPEWKLLVRQGVQTLLDDAGARAGRVDAQAFLARLKSLSKTELADEIIGPAGRAIAADAKLMARAQGAKIPEDELLDAMAARPGDASRLLEQAIVREQAYDQTYNSQIQKALRDGTLGPRTMGRPEEFVERIVFRSDASEQQLRKALAQIGAKDPAAAEAIRQQTMLKILRDTKSAVLEPGKLSTEAMDVKKLLAFANGPEGANARVVIGKEGSQFLDDLATYAAANEKRLKAPGTRVAPTGDEAGRAVAAGIGHKISLARLATDAVLAVPRAAVGTAADKSGLVRQYLATGQLPPLGPRAKALAGAARPFVLAAPELLDAREAVLAEKP